MAVKCKPSVTNGQEDTIIFADSDDDANSKLATLYRKYKDLGLPTSPKLIFFGSQTELLDIYRVYFEDFFYSVPSARRAIDVYIKTTTVLALKHSKISKLIWMFISRYIYGIKVPEKYTSIIKLEAFLNATKTSQDSEKHD